MRSYRAVVLSGVAALMLAACGGSSSSGGTTKYTLTVAKTGSGTVTSSPAGIDCGATCNAKFEKEASVTLSAAAAEGSTFGGWSGGGCTGTAATCVVPVTADTTVTVTFNAIHPTLRVFAWGGGSTTPAPGVHSYNYGDKVTLTATEDADHKFTGWSGAASGTTATTVLTLTNDVLVGARFWSGTPGASALPVIPGTPPVLEPSGAVGGLTVLDWAGYQAAVSYTFDDGLSTQEANYQALKDTGEKFTFFVVPGMVEKYGKLDAWKQMAHDGNEMGNHTKTHCHVGANGALTGCIANWAQTGQAPETTALAEIDYTDRYIKEVLGQDGVFTLASPWGEASWDPYAGAVGYIANRDIGGSRTNMLNLPSTIFGKESWGGAGYDQAVITAAIDSAVSGKNWSIFLFHGIGTPQELDTVNNTGSDVEGCCEVPIDNIVGSIRYAQGLATPVWIGRMMDVAAYQIGQKLLTSATPEVSGSTSTWHWTLPPNFPPNKYVRVTVTGGVLKQGGKALAWDSHGYYEVALDAGELTLSPAVIPDHTLTITPAGAGTVTSSVGGIDCGATCTATLPEGTLVTLTAATADASSRLGSWSGGGCTGSGACVVTLGADTTVTATFVPTFWALKFDGTTGVNQYVASEHGVKLTFDIPTTDLTAGSWTVSFDYYLVAAAAPQYTSAQVQFSSGAPNWTANYYNLYGVSTGAWNTLTYALSSMTDNASGMVSGTKFNGAKSISILFPYETDGTPVTLYLKNISMTDGTTTPLSVVLSSSSTAVGTLGPGAGSVSVARY